MSCAPRRKIDRDIIGIMITAFASTETAVEALRMGAYDYVSKPFNVDELKLKVRDALEQRRLRRENILLKRTLQTTHQFSNIIGRSEPMLEVFKLIETIAPTNSTVLVTGESGTGKELVARAIHFNSLRRDQPFVAVNCGALTETLLESELFGHMRGAFTGADSNKKGLVEVADKGTIFLDEIGEMSPLMQVKLLRVLQERKYRRVGGTDEMTADIRIIAATNRDLQTRVREGAFREDLFYRINVIPVALPAAAAAAGGHSAPGRALPTASQRANGEVDCRHLGRGGRSAGRVRLAGQRPGARKRARACRGAGALADDSSGEPASPHGWTGGRRAGDGRGRQRG